MKLNFTVRFTDERVEEVVVHAGEQLAWETAAPDRAVGRLIKQIYTNEYRLADLFSLVYVAMTKQGLFDGSLKEFTAAADISMGHHSKGEDAPEVDNADEHPTQPGPSEEH